MTQPPGALAPLVQGEVLSPSAVSDPISFAAHDFTNVLRNIVKNSPVAFKSEADVLAALNAIDAFEKRLIPSKDHSMVAAETDHAPWEDVSQRTPPQVGGLVPSNVPQIDYGALARAIIQAQQEQQASAPPPDAAPAAPLAGA